MTKQKDLILGTASLTPKFFETLIADYKGLGIAIKNCEALRTVITKVHACFDQQDVDLSEFNSVMKAAAKAVEKWRPALNAARDAACRLDGREYGEIAYRVGGGVVDTNADEDARVKASVDALDSMIAAVGNLARVVEAAATPLGALVEHSSPIKRRPGHPTNSARIYAAVSVLCEFWEEYSGKKVVVMFEGGAPINPSSNFVHKTISNFINAEMEIVDDPKIFGGYLKASVAKEMEKWKKTQKTRGGASCGARLQQRNTLI